MKALIVCSFNKNEISPFVLGQAKSLRNEGIYVEFFGIKGRGLLGYLKNYLKLIKKIEQYSPSLVHAHFGFSGLLANLQRNIPVVTTFHGSDINNSHAYRYSRWACKLSAASIFVEQSMTHRNGKQKTIYIIPCGIDTRLFHPVSKIEARKIIGIGENAHVVLFSSAFDNYIKNYPLAKACCKKVEGLINMDINLIELKNYSCQEVNLLLNASDCAFLTSLSEGSPQFIKEAMACNRPIVSTDVGDVKWVITDTPGCYLTSFDPLDVAVKLKMALDFSHEHSRTQGRERIFELGLDSQTIAKRVISVYESVLKIKRH